MDGGRQEQTLGQLTPDGGAALEPEAVLQECRQIDERLVELAMQRVYSRMLQQQNEVLQRALQETVATNHGEDGT